MHLLRSGIFLAGFVALVATQACGGDDTGGGSSGGSSGSSGGSSSGTSGSSSGTSGASSGTSGSSGVQPGDDDGLIPSTSPWRKSMEWYRAIDKAPVAEHSSQMIGALQQWGTTGIFQIDFSFNVLDGAGAPKVTFPPDDESDNVPVPVPNTGYIEGDYAYGACPSGDDCHLVILDRGASRLYEVYQAGKSGSSWEGFPYMWQLDKDYPRSNRGQGCTSADAAGLPIAPGLIGYRETKKGAINHALRFIIRNEFIRGVAGDRNVPNNVYPASHGSMAGNSGVGVPYGARLRLKATISDTDPRIKTPGARAVVRALQTYGMILSDGGNIPLTAESVRVHADANPAETWEGLLEPRDLGFIKPTDFEIIGIPKSNPTGPDGWYQSKAEYEAQMKKPLGCQGIVQP
ncbi:MAG: hypothetical protein JST00_25860 [Deltaproteobacteria bacterium]|nr:hypothetical protein [Deltaproteobacteria bacterium]